ncbi:MAG: hypothetical protein V4525_13915 [Pseudomonadota bacterium]
MKLLNTSLDYRSKGSRGEHINMHRSIRSLEFPNSRWLEVLLLPLFFNLLFILSLPFLIELWDYFFKFWIIKTELPASITKLIAFDIGKLQIIIPSVHLSGAIPSGTTWLLHLAATISLLLVSLWLPDRFIPICYLLRAVVFVHASALIYFVISPGTFSFDQETYVRDVFISMILFMLIIPWLLALTYYVFPFQVLHKIGFTFLILIYFSILTPIQSLMHVVLIYKFSTLILPIFYIFFGIFLDIMLLMALYSLAMSFKAKDKR